MSLFHRFRKDKQRGTKKQNMVQRVGNHLRICLDTPSGNHGTTRQSEEDGTLTTRFGSHIHRFAVGNIHVIGISYFHFSFDFFYFASGFGGHHFLLQLYNTAPKKR